MKLALLLAASLLLVSAAKADDAPATPPAAAGGHGSVTRDQYIQQAKDRAAKRAATLFDEMDTNHDGILDRSERAAWRSQHQRKTDSGTTGAAPE